MRRDGLKAAVEWVARTLAIYREAVATPASHASIPEFRPRFDAAIRELEQWLSRHDESRAR